MTLVTRRLFATSSLSLLAVGCAAQTPPAGVPAPAAPAAPPRPHAVFGAWGVALDNRDLSVKPGDDFNRYCNGHWFATTQVPADRSSWGSGSILAEQVNADVKAMVQEVAQRGGPPGSNEQKIADFYNSFMDTAAINAKGLAPAQADLSAIAAIRTHADVCAFALRSGSVVT